MTNLEIDYWLAHFAFWPGAMSYCRSSDRISKQPKVCRPVLDAPSEVREKLKDLKAEDICKWRPDILRTYLEMNLPDQNEENKKLVEDFDRTIQPKIVSENGVVFLRK